MTAKKSPKKGARKNGVPSKHLRKEEKKASSVKKPVKKPCRCTFGKIKCYISCILLTYLLYHIVTFCPLNNTQYPQNDLICKASHTINDYVSVYTDPVIGKVSSQYENSRIKPVVDNVENAINGKYVKYCKPTVDKVSPVIKEKTEIAVSYTITKLCLLSNKIRIFTIKASTIISEKLHYGLLVTYDYIKNVVYPATITLLRALISDIKVLLEKLYISSYVSYHLYVAPILEAISQKFHKTAFYGFLIKLEQSPAVQKIKEVSRFVGTQIEKVYKGILHLIHKFNKNELQFKLSTHYKRTEQKIEFLKTELGKFFTPGFKIPSYQDIHIFEKMESNDETIAEKKVVTTIATTKLSSVVKQLSSHSLTPLIRSISNSASTNVTSVSNTATPVSTSQGNAHENEYDDEYDETETELITKTSTVYVSSKTAPATPSERYSKMIRKVIQGAEDDFTNQVSQYGKEFGQKITKSVKPQLSALSSIVTAGYSEIHVELKDINRKSKNETGYISRQDYRDVLAKAASKIQDDSDNVISKLKKLEEEYADGVLKIRRGILETLAQFSETILSEYSKEIIKSGDDWQEWKRYNSIKKELNDAKDMILNEKPKHEQAMFDEVTTTVNILVGEGKSYLAIMRAKGNIEFQQREKAEREALKASKKDLEEPSESKKSFEEASKSVEEPLESKNVTILDQHAKKEPDTNEAENIEEEDAEDQIPSDQDIDDKDDEVTEETKDETREEETEDEEEGIEDENQEASEDENEKEEDTEEAYETHEVQSKSNTPSSNPSRK